MKQTLHDLNLSDELQLVLQHRSSALHLVTGKPNIINKRETILTLVTRNFSHNRGTSVLTLFRRIRRPGFRDLVSITEPDTFHDVIEGFNYQYTRQVLALFTSKGNLREA